jgi:lysophospholipase L1-like esterase
MAKYKIIPSSRTIVQSPISIGHKAEKGVEAIEFDVTAWVETYGSGTLTVIMRRWGDAIPYPIALEIDENNKATWVLSDTDTARAGMAYAQLSYIVGETVVKKSDIYTFRVMDSLTGEGEPPEAYESWLEHLQHLAAEAMAEVLDIEGVATDKTLTVDGGIADAKAAGDALRALEDQFTEETDQLKADLSEYVNILGERTAQLLNYIDAEIIHGFPNNGAIISAAVARSVIVPVNITENSVITIHRGILGSRFIVSSHTSKPEIGSPTVNIVTNNSGASLQISVDSSIKYLCLYFFNTGSDTGLDETECLKSIMVNVGDYDGYENYYDPRMADGAITEEKLSDGLNNVIKSITSASDNPSGAKQFNNTETQSLTWTSGYYYNVTTGIRQAAENFAHSQKISVNYNDTFFITNHNGNVLFYDDNDTYLGYVNTKYNAVVPFGVISRTSYIILNCLNTSYQASSISKVLKGKTVSNIFTQKNGEEIELLYDSTYFVQTRYTNTTTGVINTVSSFYGTAPLAIKPNHKYRIGKQSQIVYFDNKMVFVSAVVPTPINIECELDITTPETAYYMAVNSLFADNAIYDLEYVPVLQTEKKLNGKTVVCFGDSIIGNYAYGDNIPYQIEKHTGAKVYNVGFGGCRMENLVNDPQHTNYFSMVGIVDALESGDWTNQDTYASSIGAMVAKRLEVLKSIDFDEVDIVTIEYGTNEYGYTQDDATDPYNTNTYGGAIRYCVEKLLSLYPQIKICFFTPIYRYFSSSGDDSDTHEHPTMHGKLTDNVATMKMVANEYKLPCIDMYYTGGINKYNWSHYLNEDGTHPNSDGRKLLGCRYAGELNRLF